MPLDNHPMAPGKGFEPLTAGSEPAVLPLHYPDMQSLRGSNPHYRLERAVSWPFRRRDHISPEGLNSGTPGLVCCSGPDDNGIQGRSEHRSQDHQVIQRRQSQTSLPPVDCLRRIETENILQIPDGQSGLLSQLRDPDPGCSQIN